MENKFLNGWKSWKMRTIPCSLTVQNSMPRRCLMSLAWHASKAASLNLCKSGEMTSGISVPLYNYIHLLSNTFSHAWKNPKQGVIPLLHFIFLFGWLWNSVCEARQHITEDVLHVTCNVLLLKNASKQRSGIVQWNTDAECHFDFDLNNNF